MKKILVVIVILSGLYFYLNWKPSTSGIASDIKVDGAIIHKGEKYQSDWGGVEKVEGFVRRKDRHFDSNMPILTYDIVLTSGDYNDANLVTITHNGGGNYSWRYKNKPTGTIVIYHTVPSSLVAQSKLDEIEQGEWVTIVGKISSNNEIKGDSGRFVKLMHSNHKFILVQDVIKK